MDYISLGHTGLKVSRLCLGMMTYGTPQWRSWVLDEDHSRPIIKRAVEAGLNFFDTANMYSLGASEEITGRALREFARREEVVIATKVYFPMGDKPNQGSLSRKHIFEAIDASLKRLGTDYVDLYQIHRWDTATPIEETMEALHDVVKAGKARYLGASSMFAWQFCKAQAVAGLNHWTKFVAMQNHYNLIYREEEREMIPACREMGVAVIPWSPLARGFLAGNRTHDKGGETERSKTDNYAHQMYYAESDFKVADQNEKLAKRLGVSPAQLALAWLLHKPGVTAPIIGASKLYQLEEAVAALSIRVSDEDKQLLEEHYQPHAVLGHS